MGKISNFLTQNITLHYGISRGSCWAVGPVKTSCDEVMDNVQDDKSIPHHAKLPKVVVEIQVPPPAKWNLRKRKNQVS